MICFLHLRTLAGKKSLAFFSGIFFWRGSWSDYEQISFLPGIRPGMMLGKPKLAAEGSLISLSTKEDF